MHVCMLMHCAVGMHNAILRFDHKSNKLTSVFHASVLLLIMNFVVDLQTTSTSFLPYCHLNMKISFTMFTISDDSASSLQTCKEVLALPGKFLRYIYINYYFFILWLLVNVVTNQDM